MAKVSEDDAVSYRFVITRRPRPDAPPPFRCGACKRTITPSPWPYDRHQSPPICDGCTRHWMSVSRLGMTGATRGDFRRLAQLSAYLNLIAWEIKNGRR